MFTCTCAYLVRVCARPRADFAIACLVTSTTRSTFPFKAGACTCPLWAPSCGGSSSSRHRAIHCSITSTAISTWRYSPLTPLTCRKSSAYTFTIAANVAPAHIISICRLQVSLPASTAHLTAEKLLDMIDILEAIIVGVCSFSPALPNACTGILNRDLFRTTRCGSAVRSALLLVHGRSSN